MGWEGLLHTIRILPLLLRFIQSADDMAGTNKWGGRNLKAVMDLKQADLCGYSTILIHI